MGKLEIHRHSKYKNSLPEYIILLLTHRGSINPRAKPFVIRAEASGDAKILRKARPLTTGGLVGHTYIIRLLLRAYTDSA